MSPPEAAGEPRHAAPDSIDLTVTDPTTCGLTYEPSFFESLIDARSVRYEPHSLGMPAAREAVAAYYAARGCSVAPERIWLGAGTSELIAQLFWLLADPGDAVAVPLPGYPLYDVLGDLAGVRRAPYAWRYAAGWHLDPGSLREAMADNAVRAVCAVSPNHPTGSVHGDADRALLESECMARGAALIVDEVFADYPLDRGTLPFHARRESPCLTFVLSGLSKVAALPQMKLAWGVVMGPEREAAEALARIELIADAFLTVSTPVQWAAGRILSSVEAMQSRVRERCRRNLDRLRVATGGTAISVPAADGGWTALARLPQLEGLDDAGWAERLRREERLIVQPGHWFDLPADPPHVVLSLLPPEERFAEGVARLTAAVDRVVGSE